jgi:hypothetical protein
VSDQKSRRQVVKDKEEEEEGQDGKTVTIDSVVTKTTAAAVKVAMKVKLAGEVATKEKEKEEQPKNRKREKKTNQEKEKLKEKQKTTVAQNKAELVAASKTAAGVLVVAEETSTKAAAQALAVSKEKLMLSKIRESNTNQQCVELIRLQLAKRVGNSKKLVGVILKLNTPEKSLSLSKRKFFKLISRVIKQMDPKVTMTRELLVDVWDQACGVDVLNGKNENDVIEKVTLDNWLALAPP